MKRDVPYRESFLSVRYIVFHARRNKNGGDDSNKLLCCCDCRSRVDFSSCAVDVAVESVSNSEGIGTNTTA